MNFLVTWLLRCYMWWLKRKLDKRGIDIASTMAVKERDDLVELGATFGSDEKIQKVLTIVPWETFCEWRMDYQSRKR